MTPPVVLRVILTQPTAPGVQLEVTPSLPIQRSMGTGGDPVVVTFPRGSWPDDFDALKPFWITLDADGPSPVQLKEYRLRARRVIDIGVQVDDPDVDVAATEEVMLDTTIRWAREGRGGMISAGLLNEIKEDGLVDTELSTYKTNSDLIEMLLDALGLPNEGVTAGDVDFADDAVTPIDAPGPLDWGNARAITELESLLFRLGYAIAYGIDGIVRIVRLPKAGEPVTPLDPWLEDLAEPFEVERAPGLRGASILVTSGATRTTAIQERRLSELQWVSFDDRTGEWLGQADWDLLYPDEIGPEDLTIFRTGLTGPEMTPQAVKQFGQIYRFLALKSGSTSEPGDRERCARFVNIPTEVTAGDLAPFAGTPGLVEARGCFDMGKEQFANIPINDSDDRVRIDGLRVLPGKGVFLLPQDMVYARVAGGPTGRRSDLNALVSNLETNDLNIIFAHESNTGQVEMDYGLWGFTLDPMTSSLTPMDAAEVIAAHADPEVIKIGAPYLRRVVLRETEAGLPVDTTLNDDALVEIARQVAWLKVAEESMESAVVVLRGLVQISPGDQDATVSRVIFDHRTMRTYLFLNQHETPGSEEELRRRAAGDSITTGVGTVQIGRSSVSLADARAEMTADRQGGATPGSPETNAVQRGRDRSLAGTTAAAGEGPTPGMGLPRVRELTRIKAILNPAELPPVSIGPNRWIYHWEECRRNGRSYSTSGALRTSTTHGRALNDAEGRNLATGVLGTGVEVENITAGWALKPIGPACVELEGPYWDATNSEWVWYFCLPNQVDGACPAPTPPPPPPEEEGGES